MPQITIAADRLAIGVPAFERRFQRAFGAVAIPSELHIVTDGTDEAEALDAFDNTLARARKGETSR